MNIFMGHGVLQSRTYYVIFVLKNDEVINSENLSIYQNMCRQIPYPLNGHVFHSGKVQFNYVSDNEMCI